MVQFFESQQLIITCKKVTWQPPPDGYLKCNTDGGSKHNPGRSAAGFCIRNWQTGFDICKNNGVERRFQYIVAEATTIEEAMSYIAENQLVHTIIETDSQVLKVALDGIWEVPWQISNTVNEINRYRGLVSI